MEKTTTQQTESYELAIQGMQALGEIGSSAFEFANDSAKGLFSAIDNSSQRKHERKMRELQNKLSQIEMKHNENMSAIQTEQLRIQKEHERFVIKEQKEVIEMMIQAAVHVYDRKVDFLEAQQASLRTTYQEESRMIEEHIQFLEKKRQQSFNDPVQFSQLSSDLDKLNETKSRMYIEYMKADGNLSDKITILSLENPQNSYLTQSNTMFIGDK